MTAEEFRSIALGFPGAAEASHMGHPDFRANGKIFATLDYPEKGWAVVMLNPAQQDSYVRAHPNTFIPAKGAWGAAGSTTIKLGGASKRIVSDALEDAWKNRARKRADAKSSPKR